MKVLVPLSIHAKFQPNNFKSRFCAFFVCCFFFVLFFSHTCTHMNQKASLDASYHTHTPAFYFIHFYQESSNTCISRSIGLIDCKRQTDSWTDRQILSIFKVNVDYVRGYTIRSNMSNLMKFPQKYRYIMHHRRGYPHIIFS